MVTKKVWWVWGADNSINPEILSWLNSINGRPREFGLYAHPDSDEPYFTVIVVPDGNLPTNCERITL